ncbi:MAG: MmcQ/YjbR family DNA-binding protein [Chitinophagaceae bacterium]|nr:MmcQ/YjbR family DNA-binding protein [Chitinophagaceae bacterium]
MNADWLRSFCLALQGTKEDIKWGNDLCFTVAEKLFCVTALDGPFKVSFKVKDEEFEELSQQEGFMSAPYMARARWVLVTEPGRLSRNEWEGYIKQSYELIVSKLTKKQKSEIESFKKK